MLVRRKVGKTTFELLTHEGAAAKYRAGDLAFSEVLVTDTVFTNQSKGQRASQEQLAAAFGEDASPTAILTAIITKGDVQTSSAERTAKSEQRRREVLEYLVKYYVDPTRNLPIPLTRFENALTQVKARIDPAQSAEHQAEELVRKMVDIMPMRKVTMEGVLRVPRKHVGVAAGVILKHAKINREGHDAGGAKYEISVVPGVYDTLMSALGRATKGEFTFELDGGATKGVASSDADQGGGEGSGQRGGSGGRKGKAGRGGGGDRDRGGGGGRGRGRGRGGGGGSRGRGGNRGA
ncbi:hypothetical protein MMPV_009708 [Pyropia vietnamensis]